MLANMPRLAAGRILPCTFPAGSGHPSGCHLPEDEVERLMWIAAAPCRVAPLAGIDRCLAGDLRRRHGDSYLENRLNLCYVLWMPDATDIGPGEAVSISGAMLPGIMEHLAFLGRKAILTSREKGICHLGESPR